MSVGLIIVPKEVQTGHLSRLNQKPYG
jgi:hypothetical protein